MDNKPKPAVIYGISIALGIGGLSALLTAENMQLYSQIHVPPLAPPSWLFPVVWTVLYLLMGISAGLIYQNRSREPDAAFTGLAYYAISLLFNFGWSLLFFNLKSFGFAFLWLLVLLFLIVQTIRNYKPVLPLAAKLQIPYALWVTFAGYLNFAIWWLNRG